MPKADLLLQIFDTKDVLVSDETHNIELQPQGNSYKNFVELENPQLWVVKTPPLQDRITPADRWRSGQPNQ